MLDVPHFQQIVSCPLHLVVVHLYSLLLWTCCHTNIHCQLSCIVYLIQFIMNVVQHEFFGNYINLFVINGLVINRRGLVGGIKSVSCGQEFVFEPLEEISEFSEYVLANVGNLV